MTDLYVHERLYRGEEALAKLSAVRLTLCGAGALGSLIADNLVRQGIRRLTAIDHDRVEAHNAGTQLYGKGDVGAFKADVLRAHCFRAAGVEITTFAQWLDDRTARKFLRDTDLVVDTFDNSASRRIVANYCHDKALPCVHVGLFEDYGQVRWNEVYRVPSDVTAQNVCDYPLARNLILLAVGTASEAILQFALAGRRENFSVTLRDLKITREEE
jgi:molybdopterin/thiamine biosynthesis adenylyltransferase